MTLPEKLRQPWIVGGIISLLGTLPFGVLNILAFTIAAKESVFQAILFSFGVIVSEMCVVLFCLQFARIFRLKAIVFDVLQYLLIGFIFFLAVLQVLQINAPVHQQNDFLSSNYPRFLLGLGLSAINPSQFPFWISWNGILSNKGILATKWDHFSYLLGIGFGTFCGLLCFIIASQLFSISPESTQSVTYCLVMASIFAITGSVMLFKTLKNQLKTNDNLPDY